jgi:hypothetical protein
MMFPWGVAVRVLGGLAAGDTPRQAFKVVGICALLSIGVMMSS